MNIELLLSIGKHTHKLIEQSKTKPQETVDFKMNKQMEFFSFNAPINLIEEGKGLLGVTSFEATNSVLNITDENNSFLISTPCHWNSEDDEEFFNKLNKWLELRSESDIELHVEQFEKRGSSIEIENSGCILAGFDHFKNEKIADSKRAKYKDLEDMVYRMLLTLNDIVDLLEVKYIAGSFNGYTIPTGIYKIVVNNLMLKSLNPNKVKVNIKFDGIRLRSILTTHKTTRFAKNSFLSHTRIHSITPGSIR